jgi:putative ABC transport system substrate-binding protein
MHLGRTIPRLFPRAATYATEFQKGPGTSDQPVEQATKLELVINLKTAKAIGHHDHRSHSCCAADR